MIVSLGTIFDRSCICSSDLIDDNELPNEPGASRQEAFRSYRDMARNLEEDEEDDEAGLEKFLKERYERYDQVSCPQVFFRTSTSCQGCDGAGEISRGALRTLRRLSCLRVSC